MRVLITGAAGFIGTALVRRLLSDPAALGLPDDRPLTLSLIDQTAALARTEFSDARIRAHGGDMSDPRLLRRALADGADCVFHLASLPGGAAERDYAQGRRINLDATLSLFEQIAEQAKPARVVFASSIAVYGSRLPVVVDDHTLPQPGSSYGAHKLAAEVLLADFSRRGRLDGLSLRLPGIVARPLAPSGLISAYMSDLLSRLAAGQPFVCPVSEQATSWWMSVRCCVDNLLRAARVSLPANEPARAWALPVLHASMREVVQSLATVYGADRLALVGYAPDPTIEAAFGSYPPLHARRAEALGFRHDGSLENLVRNALPVGASATSISA